jgi:mRNA interferase RelE/StbE
MQTASARERNRCGHPAASRTDDLAGADALGDDPRRTDSNVKKLAGYDDRYRLRVGDYRVIYEVIDGQLVVLVVGVGHRREIYRGNVLTR